VDWKTVGTGLLAAIALAVGLVWSQFGVQIQAARSRSPHPGLENEPFFPAPSATADAVAAAVRQSLSERAARLAPAPAPADDVEGGEPPPTNEGDASGDEVASAQPKPIALSTEEGLRATFPALAELGDGAGWFVSVYHPTPGKGASGPWVTDLRGGAAEAAGRLWDRLPGVLADAKLPEQMTIKVDQLIGGEREFPLDGGYKGVALDEGIDGVVLRHEAYEDPFYYLPSWPIEREVKRSGIHGRARNTARTMARWKKSRTKAADFAAVRTRAWVESKRGGGPLVPTQRGNTDLPPIDAALLRERIAIAGDYLTRETNEAGKITYDYQADTDTLGKGYNILRHAGTAYSMMQAYRIDPDPATLEAVKRAVGYYRRKMKEDDNHPGEWFVLDGRRAKLGGVGLGLCMFVELEKAAPGSVDMERVLGMARHIERMQLPSGEFLSFYDWHGKGVTRRKSIYYSGEAILGLVRVYELTGDEHWLDVAEKGADFLVNERWKSLGVRFYVPPDAWLTQALEELDRFRPDDARARYALSLGEVIARNKIMDPEGAPADFVGADVARLHALPNAATAGAFGEALSAAARLEARRFPSETRYRDWAMKNAEFQLRNQFVEANSWYLPNPERAHGGFRLRQDNAEIRNDYVQHNLSGLFGLLDLLDETAPDIGAVTFEGAK
jgi:hypothetical protein